MSVDEAMKSARQAIKNLELAVDEDGEFMPEAASISAKGGQGDTAGLPKQRQGSIPQHRATSLNRVKRNTAQVREGGGSVGLQSSVQVKAWNKATLPGVDPI